MMIHLAKSTFYASKVNIHGNIFSQNLDELISIHIPRVILESTSIKINSWNWTFTDVEKVSVRNKQLIIGNLTKSKFAKQKVRVGKKTTEKVTEHELAKPAFFAYDISQEILIHERKSDIKINTFINVFKKLLSIDPYVGDVIINPIPIPYEIRKEILSIENVTKLKFDLIHPNPGKEEYNLYSEIINDHKLKRLNMAMESEEGIEVLDDETTRELKSTIDNGVQLAESGYGDVDVKGFDTIKVKENGKDKIRRKTRSFSSKNAIKRKKISKSNKDSLLSNIVSFIMEVKQKK